MTDYEHVTTIPKNMGNNFVRPMGGGGGQSRMTHEKQAHPTHREQFPQPMNNSIAIIWAHTTGGVTYLAMIVAWKDVIPQTGEN